MNLRDLPGRPRVNYALMLHVPTYRIYAFRYAMPGMHLTGGSGPHDKDEWRRTPLESVEYDEGDLRAWAEARLSEFEPFGIGTGTEIARRESSFHSHLSLPWAP
jgi:hypothetical protein